MTPAPTHRVTAAPTHAEMVRSVLDTYASSTPTLERAGRAWYATAQREARAIAREYDLTVRTAAGIIAALSPRQRWGTNVAAAWKVADAAARGGRMPRAGLKSNVRKAWRIANGERPLSVLGGDKVRAFYRNITGDTDAVTVDVWAARAAGASPDGLRGAAYDRIADAYRAAAAVVGLTPRDFQAAVWCTIRGAAA